MDDWQFNVVVGLITLVVGVVTFAVGLNLRHQQKVERHLQEVERHQQEIERNQQGQSLVIHQVLSQLPATVVHIVLTPSAASQTKDKNLRALLDHLKIDFPLLSNDIYRSEKFFSRFNFKWAWPAGCTDEVSVYDPFCAAFNDFISSSTQVQLVSAAVGNGQRLADGLLFSTPIFTLREYDVFNKKKGKVLYRGEVRGRTDIVIMDSNPLGDIARHNVLFAIEIKKDLTRPSELQSGLREACTELLGLCGDNNYRTPPVLLTNFVSCFVVVHLNRVSEVPLLFSIAADRCSNLKSALSLAYSVSMQDCISADFGRPDTPTGSDYS